MRNSYHLNKNPLLEDAQLLFSSQYPSQVERTVL